MTISSLTDAELDRMIAEKRGWRKIDFGRGEIVWRYMNDFPMYKDDEAPVHFTTDPRYAMELLKEMIDTGNTIVIFKEGDKYTFDGEADKCVGVADTPERAIAEAWMEWKK